MSESFAYDVFLSYSSKDKEIVRPVAERLRSDGLRVWFDDWEMKPGDNILVKIEEGLEHSRILIFCMSADAFGSEWAQLEAGTFRFRDPLNKARRFIPLRLDDAPCKGSLSQFLFIDWRPAKREQEYAKLLESCQQPAKHASNSGTQPRFQTAVLSLGHIDTINSVAWSSDGQLVLSGSCDKTVRVWKVKSGRCLRVLEGHTDSVNSVASTFGVELTN